MTDYKIEFEWNNDEDQSQVWTHFPTKEEATEIYHEAEKALIQACHDRKVVIPDVAWLLAISECQHCGNKRNTEVIQ